MSSLPMVFERKGAKDMAMYGADVVQLRTLAQRMDLASRSLDSIAASLHSQVQGARWEGADGVRFSSDWSRQYRPDLREVARRLDDAAKLIRRNATDQERASSSAGPSTQSTVKRSDRLDPPTERRAELAKQGKYLANADIARESLPNAFKKAQAWYDELIQGDPTAEEVAAFESYMAMIKLAHRQKEIVRMSAEHAYDQFVEAGKAGAGVIGTAVGAGDAPDGGLADQAFEKVLDMQRGDIADAATDPLQHAVGAVGADAMVQNYLLDAHAMLADLEADFRAIDRVGFSDPDDLMNAQYSNYDGMREVAADKALLADAFTPLTGDGSHLDSALRGGLEIIGGPAAKSALDGLGIVGGSAQAGFHVEGRSASFESPLRPRFAQAAASVFVK